MVKNTGQKIPKITRPWGAHVSIAGGVANAPGRAARAGARAFQVFTKNNNQWKGKPLTAGDIKGFHENSKKLGVHPAASHDCYLINLASPDREMLKKSRAAFLDEIDRAEALGLGLLVFHPGAHKGAGEREGLKIVAESLEWAIERRPESRVVLTLETTAGQGTSLGYRFEQLAWIMEKVKEPERVGVCLDTCHVFAAGYGIDTESGYTETFEEFGGVIGIGALKMFHLNDSKRERGSRVDRHEHIGKGRIGPDAFRMLVNDPRFYDIPMILETPKGPEGAEDIMNLSVLSRLLKEGRP